MRERCDETATRCIDVDWDVIACLSFIFVQNLGDLLDRFVMAGIRRAQDHEDTDRVLVNILLDQFWIESEVAL